MRYQAFVFFLSSRKKERSFAIAISWAESPTGRVCRALAEPPASSVSAGVGRLSFLCVQIFVCSVVTFG